MRELAPPPYTCSAQMDRLLDVVVQHPDLGFRLWAGMTVLINMDVLEAHEEAEEVAIDVISSCVVTGRYSDHLDEEFELVTQPDGTVTDVLYDDVYGEDVRAAALLALMKSPDHHARRLALKELTVATATGGMDVEITALALLRLAGWIERENYTRH